MVELGMPGFQIGSSCEGLNLDSREMDPIYKTCEDLGAVIFVHPWDMQMGGRMSKYWLPWLVGSCSTDIHLTFEQVGMPAETATAVCCILMGGVLQRFPKLKVQLSLLLCPRYISYQPDLLCARWRGFPVHRWEDPARIQGEMIGTILKSMDGIGINLTFAQWTIISFRH